MSPPSPPHTHTPTHSLFHIAAMLCHTSIHYSGCSFPPPQCQYIHGILIFLPNSGDESGQECCYDNNGNLLVWPPAAGTADAVSPRIFNDPFLHYLYDLLPAIHCCRAPAASISSCRVYAMHRPSDNCFQFNPIPPGINTSERRSWKPILCQSLCI